MIYVCYIYMSRIRFSWDERKNRENQDKHGVSFEEAQTVFFDENALEFFDPDHSEDEDRFLMLGLSFRFRILLVCHCLRKTGGEIRLISARKATRKEKDRYEKGAKP